MSCHDLSCLVLSRVLSRVVSRVFPVFVSRVVSCLVSRIVLSCVISIVVGAASCHYFLLGAVCVAIGSRSLLVFVSCYTT